MSVDGTASPRVLVTGGAGFIGRHLVQRLVATGHEVVVLDNLRRATRPSAEDPRQTFVEGDIRSYETVERAAEGCSVVYHLAAQSNVMGAVQDPEYGITTNVMGTFQVLRAAAKYGARVVFTSSREVYGEPRSLPVDEDAPLTAKNPYGASKVAGEAYCRTFAHVHGIRVEIVRLANAYGPGDSGRVIPLWMRAALEGKELTVYGGQQVIDFVWVGTIVDALTFAAKHGLPGPINIGAGVGTSILDLGRRILEVTGSKSQLVKHPAREIEVAKFVANVGRMRALGLIPESDPLAHLPELVAAYAPPRAGA